MLDKTAGAVCCAHCQGSGASRVCASCGGLVCADCARQDTCPEPHRRELHLGAGARLVAVDEDAEVGLVVGWTGRVRTIELSQGTTLWEWPGMPLVGVSRSRETPLCRVGPHRVAWESQELHGPALRIGDLRTGTIIQWSGHAAGGVLGATADGAYLVGRRGDERVEIFDVAAECSLGIVGGGREVVQALAASSALDLVAVGTYGHVAFYRLQSREPLGTWTRGPGDSAWIGLAAGRVALLTEDLVSPMLALSARDVARVVEVDLALPPFRWREIPARRLDAEAYGAASLSADGRLLAVAQDRTVVVLDLERGERQVLEGHTDRVNLVCFVRGGRLLVSADCDARVLLWPRVGERLVTK